MKTQNTQDLTIIGNQQNKGKNMVMTLEDDESEDGHSDGNYMRIDSDGHATMSDTEDEQMADAVSKKRLRFGNCESNEDDDCNPSQDTPSNTHSNSNFDNSSSSTPYTPTDSVNTNSHSDTEHLPSATPKPRPTSTNTNNDSHPSSPTPKKPTNTTQASDSNHPSIPPKKCIQIGRINCSKFKII